MSVTLTTPATVNAPALCTVVFDGPDPAHQAWLISVQDDAAALMAVPPAQRCQQRLNIDTDFHQLAI